MLCVSLSCDDRPNFAAVQIHDNRRHFETQDNILDEMNTELLSQVRALERVVYDSPRRHKAGESPDKLGETHPLMSVLLYSSLLYHIK